MPLDLIIILIYFYVFTAKVRVLNFLLGAQLRGLFERRPLLYSCEFTYPSA